MPTGSDTSLPPAQTPPGDAWGYGLVAAARRASGADACVAFRYQDQRDTPIARTGTDADTLSGDAALTPRCALRDNAAVYEDTARLVPEHPLLSAFGGAILAPIRTHAGELAGCLCALHAEPGSFGDEDIDAVETIAALAGARFQAEHAGDAGMQESVELLEKLTTCVPGVLYRFDMDPDGSTRFPYSSARMRDIYRIDPELVEHDASAAWEIIHPDDLASLQRSVERSRAALSTWRDRYRVVRPDGEVRWLQGEANPTRRDDGGTSWLGYIHDVTEDVEREQRLDEARREALAATKTKSEFLANIGHEVRTPLGAIMGYAEILEEDAAGMDPIAREAIRTIRRNSEHLLGLVNDLLDVSKIEAGRLQIELMDMSPIEIVADVIATMRVRAEAKGLALLVEWEGSIPERIHSDPTRLRQVLINLVSNAIKFTHEGTVTLRVACDASALALQFEVRDTGIGMSPGQLETVRRFEAFTQGDASTARRFGGTGLGLRLCAGLALDLGDGLEIESEEGVGTACRVRIATGALSAVPMVAPGGGASKASSPADGLSLEGVRVLLAEDGADNRRLLTHHLKKAGATIRIAEDGAQAIEACAAERFDIVLMDMMMPVVDGYGATRALRGQGYAGPIVAITAHATEADRDACLDAGCDGFLTKPISATSLVRACLRFARRAEAA